MNAFLAGFFLPFLLEHLLPHLNYEYANVVSPTHDIIMKLVLIRLNPPLNGAALTTVPRASPLPAGMAEVVSSPHARTNRVSSRQILAFLCLPTADDGHPRQP